MVKAKVDLLAIDSAHGHTTRVLDAIKQVKAKFPEVDLIAGNVATFEGACELVKAPELMPSKSASARAPSVPPAS